MPNEFLRAEWRKLAMANYIVDEKVLAAYLPHKTEIDRWNNRCYVSLVGFMFLNTRIKGMRIPFHSNFEEVNLRFYVRYKASNEWKRGVVFVREIVPRPALTFVANTVYGENYVTLPMQHTWESGTETLHVTYRWKKQKWNSLSVTASPVPTMIADGSEEEFITEHYWGYTKQGERTSEYKVEHPRWQVYPTNKYEIEVDYADVYGPQFGFLSQEKPSSVFLAEGSEIKVNGGRRIA